MRVEFTIDELVLVGFEDRDRHRLANEIEIGLASALTFSAVRGFIDRRAAGADRSPPDVRGADTMTGSLAGIHGIGPSIVAAASQATSRRGSR
jgi:hypothetical protein